MHILYRGRRVRCVGRRKARRAGPPRPATRPACLVRVKPQRSSLLLGTALVSTLLLGSLIAPSPALAVDCPQDPSPAPIHYSSNTAEITCVNTETRRGNATYVDAIQLDTTGDGFFINLDNSGLLYAYTAGDGINTATDGVGSYIYIVNSAAIVGDSDGIQALTQGDASEIFIFNDARVEGGSGFNALTNGQDSEIQVSNSGEILANVDGMVLSTLGDFSTISVFNYAAGTITTAVGDAIDAVTLGEGSTIFIYNYAELRAGNRGINAETTGDNADIRIDNEGDIFSTLGIRAVTYGADDATIEITNRGDITAVSYGIFAETNGTDSGIMAFNTGTVRSSDSRGIALQINNANSRITLRNFGDVTGDEQGIWLYSRVENYTGNTDISTLAYNFGDVVSGDNFDGIYSTTSANTIDGNNISRISLSNYGGIDAGRHGVYLRTGAFTVTGNNNSSMGFASFSGDIRAEENGIFAITDVGGIDGSNNSLISILNLSDINAGIDGISASTRVENVGLGNVSSIGIDNRGDIVSSYNGITAITYVNGVNGTSSGSTINITNNGAIAAGYDGIYAVTDALNVPANATSGIFITNIGDVNAARRGIVAVSSQDQVNITNFGTVFGGHTGVVVAGVVTNTITNYGSIGAANDAAIFAQNAPTSIVNQANALITGFVELHTFDDVMQNRGTFNARLDSNFGAGDDRFTNYAGGIVRTAHNGGAMEITRFNGLENFYNSGLVTLIDGGEGDRFFLSGNFHASGGVLGVDAFLGPPGSIADVFQVENDVTGETALRVNNTSPFGGALNQDGIVVVEVLGNVQPNAFFLENGPIDAGFFVYELFFEPGATNIFELRSGAPGSSAFILPQLITASQDIWHATAGTWFDRSADLRVLLNGGGPGMGAGGYGMQPMRAAPPIDQAGYSAFGQSVLNTPAVWAKGSGTWLDRDGSATSSAFGSTFNFNLNRDLDVFQLESGIDMGMQGLFSERDTLVFGILGGFIASGLDYDKLAARFDYRGGEVGGYATYLNGGWFVDTLVKVDLLEVDTEQAPGFPSSFDSTTWGLRTDTGYRFGGWRGGAFLEPLATIEVIWADIDDFTAGPNRIAFDDEANVRGRLGLRAGLSQALWSGITMEPFVIGSVWGNLDGDNQASLNSFGTPFLFTDDIPDVWGEASLGVNFFAPGVLTALYAKADVTFGDEIDGFAGKGGMRIAW